MPENVCNKKMYFDVPNKINNKKRSLDENKRGSVISGIESQRPAISHYERFELQAMVCEILKIEYVLFKVKEFCLGNIPADIVSGKNPEGGDSLLWFAVNRNNELVIIDIIDWIAFPTFSFSQFPCLCLHNKKKKNSLYNLSNLLDKNSDNISSGDYVDMQNDLQNLYTLL